ncbi:MAG: hypothetical protein EZS26_000757 [Candidatus Ordinivivax streblomastigis]|uniref:HNH endonuclease n=1 Tax=Candidatus Ordinivivax streblomastigis TaxID=2540710 RepID=A0A5M8P447_9BACT|nr:MAG: hypothetical protein EZS26_000757 [Candidatus Ordinivivax streblomastigis]
MENWKDIPGYEGLYQVSNLGKIRSLDRLVNNQQNGIAQRLIKGRVLKSYSGGAGYLYVTISINQIKKKYLVHRLVMLSFIGDKNLTVNHINEVKTDNRLINLEYCTQKDNCNKGTRNIKLSDLQKRINSENLRKRNNRGYYI